MPPQPALPDALAWQVFRGTDAIRAGLLTEHQLRSKAWRRLLQDVYADARLPRDHRLLCLAAALRLPKEVLIAGPSAAVILGAETAAAFTDPVHVIAPLSVRVSAMHHIRVHVVDLDPGDAVLDGAPPHTTARRTARDVAAWLSPPDAVAILDAMLRRGLMTSGDLAEVPAASRGARHYRRIEFACRIADAASRDPFASHLRASLIMAGIPTPVLDYTTQTPAGVDVHADMAWPDLRVTVEFTMRRVNQLTRAGWLVVEASPTRVREDFPHILAELRRAFDRRKAQENRKAPTAAPTPTLPDRRPGDLEAQPLSEVRRIDGRRQA